MTTTTPITQDEINAVFPTVAETMADALGCDVEDIKPNVSLIEGLDAESIDFLDMVFRLERAFKIKIPRGKIVENARGSLTEAEFEQKGIVTDAGLAQLQVLPVRGAGRAVQDADEGRGHSAALHARDVLQARRAGAARREGRRLGRALRRMSDHFAAFSFVDRITEFEPGARARGAYRDPGRRRRVSAVPRRRSRRAAGGVGRDGAHRLSRPAGRGARERDALPARRAPGRRCSTSPSTSRAATTRRSPTAARREVGGARVIELDDCLGPMLPVAEFDDPEALAARFALLRGEARRRAASAACRCRRSCAPAACRASRRRGTLAVPADAPFFGDHFPRRPVFPATLLLDAQIGLALAVAAESGRFGAGGAARARADDPREDALVHAAGPDAGADARSCARAATDTATFQLTAEADGKTVATARVEIREAGNS